MKKLSATLIIAMIFTSIFAYAIPLTPTMASPTPGPSETREVSQAVQLTTDAHYDRDCCFLEDEYGTYWLFFTRGRGDPASPGYNPDTDFYDIYYLKSTDGGNTWTEYSMPSHVNDPYGQREVAAYEIPEIDTIVVFFTDAFYGDPYGTPTYGVYYTYTNDGGATWHSVRQVPDVTAYHIDVLNAYGKRWLFYEGPGAIIYVTYCELGVWSTPIQISESGKHGGIPKAMIDDDGNFNVVWCGWTEGGIYRSTSADGITWSTPELILTSSYIACDPMLVQDSTGTYWLFWAPWDSATDSQWLEVVYSTDGTTWSSSIHVTSGGYGGNYWWDMWPEAYQVPSRNMLLFYTSEVSGGGGGAGVYTKGDGNIWMFNVTWNLTRHHYEFIQNAIDAANPDDTILVHDGIYAEALYITQNVTIKAASKPVIKGSKLFTTDYGDREAVIFVKNAGNVVLEGLDIEGYGLGPGPTKSYGILYQNSSGTVRNCIISPNTIGDMYSVGIAAISRSNLTVEECTIKNFGRIGVYATNVENILISGNEIIGQVYDQDNLVNYGIEIECWDGASTATIIDNEIYNSDNIHPSPLWSSAAIIIDIWRMYYDLPPSTVAIERNNIHDNFEAIQVVSNPSLYAHHNNIYNNRYGVYVDPDLYGNNATFDARFNWWGDASGPSGSGPGLGDSIGDYVQYSPWLGYSYETTPMTYHVDPTGKIQDAIDDASPEDTIIVHEGTYNEGITVDKALTILGQCDVILDGTGIDVHYGVHVTANNVTIKNFHIANFTYGWGWGVQLTDADYCLLENLTVEKCNSGINLYGGSDYNTIQNCEIRGIGGHGISIYGSNLGCTHNIIRDNRIIGCAWYMPYGKYHLAAMPVFSGASNNIIEGNIINGTGVGYGICLWGYTYGRADMPQTENLIRANNISNFDTALYIRGHNPDTGTLNLVTSTSITENNIVDNRIGVYVEGFDENVIGFLHYNNIEGNAEYGALLNTTYGTTILDARFNWWGDVTGPYHETSWTYMGEPYGPHYGLGDNVSDYVLYDPWQGKIVIQAEPPTYQAKRLNETFVVNITINDVHIDWRVIGVQFRLTYNATLLQLLNVTEGPFMAQAGTTLFMCFIEEDDPVYGANTVVGILILPNATGQWNVFPEGSGVIATLTFKTIYQHKGIEKQPLSCTLQLIETKIINDDLKEILHTVNSGYYEILPNNIGDINWDYKVDIMDVATAAAAFGSYPGHERWNPVADVNGDGKVDIYDVAIIAANFGWQMDPDP